MKFLVASFLILSSISAQSQNIEKGAQLYGTCIQCHGEKGMGKAEEKAPRIAVPIRLVCLHPTS